MKAFRLFGLLIVALCALPGQEQGSGDDSYENESYSSAFVSARLNRSGMLFVSVHGYMYPKREIELGTILTREFRCVNRPSGTGVATCRVPQFAPADGGEHTVDLTNLHQALRSAGFDHVSHSLSLSDAQVQDSGNWKTSGKKSTYLTFNPEKDQTPSLIRLTVPYSKPFSPLVPILAILVLPIGLAAWLSSRKEANIAWIHWMVNAIWFGWIYSWNTEGFADLLLTQAWANDWIVYATSVLTYGLPPLIAVSITIYLLAPDGDSLKTIALQNTQQMLPLALFFASGSSSESPSVMFVGVFAAYILHHLLGAILARHTRAVVREVVAGEWFEHITRLAATAGVKLQRLLLHRSETSKAVNAFAIPGNQVMLSDSLIREMPRREVEAIVGHELGHLKKNDGIAQTLFWVAYFVFGANLLTLILPEALRGLPIGLVLAIIGMARLSQFHEFRADAFSARLTGDPESMIAGLGRLAAMTGCGLRWSKFAGLILTHPSMEERALRLARDFEIPRERALAILENPDLIHDPAGDVERLQEAVSQAEESPEPRSPAAVFAVESVFTRPETQQFSKHSSWIVESTIVFGTVGLALAAGLLTSALTGEEWYERVLLLVSALALPLIAAWFASRAEEAFERRQFRKWERELRERLQPAAGARFVALRPGSKIDYFGGMLDWDIGFLSFSGNQLEYQGERIRFNLPASAVWQVERHSSRALWETIDGVHIVSNAGAFSLREPLEASEWKGLLSAMETWWLASDPSQTDPPAAPLLPELEAPPSMIVGLVMYAGWEVFKIMLATMLISTSVLGMFIASLGLGIWFLASSMFLAPIAYLIYAAPGAWRSMRRNGIKTTFHPRFAQRVPTPAMPPPPIEAPPPLPDAVEQA